MLAALVGSAISTTRRMARSAVSLSNIRQLATANLAYAADHRGRFVPAMNFGNTRRWHGVRAGGVGGSGDPFRATGGYLSPYLGESGMVKDCPVFSAMELAPADAGSFEESTGSGGYGYNMAYLGGLLRNDEQSYEEPQPYRLHELPKPSSVLMFASTAFPKPGAGRGQYGIMEYAFAEPFYPRGPFTGATQPLTPSLHFRHGGKAHVAWCDGHVTAEPPTIHTDIVSASVRKLNIGHIDPLLFNGKFNPFPEKQFE